MVSPRVAVSDRPVMTGAMIALAVLALHLIFGLGVALSPPLRGASAAGRPLVLLTELPPPSMSASTGTVAVDLDLPVEVSVAPPRPATPKLPGAPDTDGVIVDAAPADDAQVARICGLGAIQRAYRDAEQVTDVLVRVEADGRVSDSRLLVGTGSSDHDAALRHCLSTLARLTPIRLDGQIVPAWQRLKPLVRSSRR